MKIKKLASLGLGMCMACLASGLFAQNTASGIRKDKPLRIIKFAPLNVFNPIYGNFAMAYEHQISQKKSFCLELGILSKSIYLSSDDMELSEPVEDPVITVRDGFMVKPGMRIYLNQKNRILFGSSEAFVGTGMENLYQEKSVVPFFELQGSYYNMNINYQGWTTQNCKMPDMEYEKFTRLKYNSQLASFGFCLGAAKVLNAFDFPFLAEAFLGPSITYKFGSTYSDPNVCVVESSTLENLHPTVTGARIRYVVGFRIGLGY